MAASSRLVRSLARLFVPAIILFIAAVLAGSVWLVYTAAHPKPSSYLITPEKFGRISSRAAQITNETWPAHDGTTLSGWLLRGAPNAPAVILYHRYGVNRSHELNLGVKLSEATDFTVLMPDLRSHGDQLQKKGTSFGGCDTEDALSAIEFLRGLRTPDQIALIGKDIGVYGVELGALTALFAAAKDPSVKALALDSVPENSDQLLDGIIRRKYPFANFITAGLAKIGTHIYFYDGCYDRNSTCDTARNISDRKVLLLAGVDSAGYQESTAKLAKCFPDNNKIEVKTDLSPSGFSIIDASIEQSDAYHQRVIDFFRSSLAN